MLTELFGKIDRSVLTAGTAKINHKVLKSTGIVVFNCLINYIVNIAKEKAGFGLHGKIVGNRFIEARKCPELLQSSRVGQSPAIKHKASAIAGMVSRNLLFIGKAADAHF